MDWKQRTANTAFDGLVMITIISLCAGIGWYWNFKDALRPITKM